MLHVFGPPTIPVPFATWTWYTVIFIQSLSLSHQPPTLISLIENGWSSLLELCGVPISLLLPKRPFHSRWRHQFTYADSSRLTHGWRVEITGGAPSIPDVFHEMINFDY